MKLDDLRISIKVVLPTVILAAVALACTGMGFWQDLQAQGAARILVEQRLPAEVMSARFNRRISIIGYAAYRTVALAEDPKLARGAAKAIDVAYDEGRDSLDHMR